MRTKLIKFDLFALIIAICNTFGYLTPVIATIIIDRYTINFVFKPSNLPAYDLWTYLILFIALPIAIFFITYMINISAKNGNDKAKYTYLSLLLTWLAIIPMRPRPDILLVPLCFGFITASSVYIHNYKIDFQFVYDKSLSEALRIERVKIEYETWFRFFIAAFTSYAALAIAWIALTIQMAPIFDSDPFERAIIQFTFVCELIVHATVFITTLGLELVRKIKLVKDQLGYIGS